MAWTSRNDKEDDVDELVTNSAHMIVYSYIQILLLIIILVMVILVYNKDSFSNKSSFEDQEQFDFTSYTKSDIEKKWKATGCTKKLNSDLIKALTIIPKDTADSTINMYKTRTGDCYITVPVKNKIKYTPEQKAELQAIWTNSKCPAPYPVNYVNALEQNTNYTNGKNRFIQYVNDILRNNKHDDVPYMTLQKSFETCYGAGWEKNQDLSKQYYSIS
jgi:hypothetical protein